MITMRIKGGMGNQLFQYAAAYALSQTLQQPFMFDVSFTHNMTNRDYKLTHLRVKSDTIISRELLPWEIRIFKNIYVNKALRLIDSSTHLCGDWLYFLETKDVWQNDFFFLRAKNIYLDGYFQSYKYFDKYREDLISQFMPRKENKSSVTALWGEMSKTNSVAVHVRRSDYKGDRHPFHYIIEEEYYNNAICFIRKKVENPIFYWFSDDVEWVKKNVENATDFVFVNLHTEQSDIDEFMLMKNCRHIITANSTFSWWAAWLNTTENCIRIVPSKQYGMDGMIPDSWIKI